MIPFDIDINNNIIVEALDRVLTHNTYLYAAGVLKTHTYDNEIQYNVEKYNSSDSRPVLENNFTTFPIVHNF